MFTDDINIRFFEEGEDGMVKWQSFGQFGPSDVHRQVSDTGSEVTGEL